MHRLLKLRFFFLKNNMFQKHRLDPGNHPHGVGEHGKETGKFGYIFLRTGTRSGGIQNSSFFKNKFQKFNK